MHLHGSNDVVDAWRIRGNVQSHVLLKYIVTYSTSELVLNVLYKRKSGLAAVRRTEMSHGAQYNVGYSTVRTITKDALPKCESLLRNRSEETTEVHVAAQANVFDS